MSLYDYTWISNVIDRIVDHHVLSSFFIITSRIESLNIKKRSLTNDLQATKWNTRRNLILTNE